MRISRFGSGTPRCRPSLARIRRFRRRNHCDKPTARHPNWREIEAFGPIRRSHRGDAGPRPPSQYQPPPVFLVATGIQSPDYAPTRSWQRRGAGWTTASHRGRLPSAQPSLHTKWALDSRCGENGVWPGPRHTWERRWPIFTIMTGVVGVGIASQSLGCRSSTRTNCLRGWLRGYCILR